MSNDNPQDYGIPVHRSLLKRDLLLGISKTAVIILFFVTVFLVLGLGQWWFLAISIISVLILKPLTNKDPYIVEVLLNAFQEPDDLYP